MFRFKQFTVRQDRCAMKVSTDSILLGSWCQPREAAKILDIGTGTGLLSLMMAQKSLPDTLITALEIDASAAAQARDNVSQSPWPTKIKVLHNSLQSYFECEAAQSEKFDLIISNPPWFEYTKTASHNIKNQIREYSRTLARQQLNLSLETLLQISSKLLREKGQICLVLPVSAESSLLNDAEKYGFKIADKVMVRNSEKHLAHCQLWRLIKAEYLTEPFISTVFIRTESNDYSPQFQQLCRDFYLKF